MKTIDSTTAAEIAAEVPAPRAKPLGRGYARRSENKRPRTVQELRSETRDLAARFGAFARRTKRVDADLIAIVLAVVCTSVFRERPNAAQAAARSIAEIAVRRSEQSREEGLVVEHVLQRLRNDAGSLECLSACGGKTVDRSLLVVARLVEEAAWLGTVLEFRRRRQDKGATASLTIIRDALARANKLLAEARDASEVARLRGRLAHGNVLDLAVARALRDRT